MEEKKVLLSVKDLVVKFKVRGRILTAIRGISLDIYENESIAIVGESGSGKSVFTKTFAGMLDANGFIDKGSLIFSDETLSDTRVGVGKKAARDIAYCERKLNEYARLEHGGAIRRELLALKAESKARYGLTEAESREIDDKLSGLKFRRTECFNHKQTIDAKQKSALREADRELKELDGEIKALEAQRTALLKAHKAAADGDAAYKQAYEKKNAELLEAYRAAISKPAKPEALERNKILAREVILSVGRYEAVKRTLCIRKLLKALKKAMELGVDLNNEAERNSVFGTVTFRVRFLREENETLYGDCIIDLAQIRDADDWSQVRGARIATVFQDPMTSLNPIITIGKQISSIIIKHQGCSEAEARLRAMELMAKVGIPNPETRYDDYPFQYSGGMRQRIVIAIALSCQPKILICDEPTTALDVTIQAQILKLIKDLQKEFGYTIVFITHDLGVVANIADRVAVLYAGQVIEVGTVEEVFYDPRHPYTWALLSSLPQLAQKNTKLYSITGTPPSLYNAIRGDAFAPRNPYCMKIDRLAEPPMFKVTETHYAKTWLLHPDAPAAEKPEIIRDIHEKLVRAFNI